MHVPKWPGPVEGYVKNYIRTNLWRYEALGYDFDDLINEAWIVFARCTKNHEFKSPEHFMGFFKTALHNSFFDIMKKSIKELKYRKFIDNEETTIEDFSQVEEQGTLRVLLSQAPKEIKEVFNLLFNAPTEILEALGFGMVTKRGQKMLSNRKLCSFLGYNPTNVNLIKMIKEYLTVSK